MQKIEMLRWKCPDPENLLGRRESDRIKETIQNIQKVQKYMIQKDRNYNEIKIQTQKNT